MEKKKRICDDCGKQFKPMTNKQWKIVEYIHKTCHKNHLR